MGGGTRRAMMMMIMMTMMIDPRGTFRFLCNILQPGEGDIRDAPEYATW